MTKIIDTSAQKQKPIRHVGPTQPRLDPAEVARALGAERAGVTLEGVLGPITLFAVREELFKRLESSGGRPALAGTSRRAKVPLGDAEWQQLEELAASAGSAGFAPSAGQVASVLLSAALRQVASEPAAGQPNSPLARELAQRVEGGEEAE
jgi:hypothetical protein